MAGNFMKYGASDATFGPKTANDIPVDSHELIAMCAPRLTFVSYGVPEKGDAKWLDHQGSYMAADRRSAGLSSASRQGSRRLRRPSTTLRRCPASTLGYWMANSPGGSTMAATPMLRM